MNSRVVLFTRSSRPSGAQMAWRLIRSGIAPIAVIIEKRSRMVTQKKRSPWAILSELGLEFVWKRVWEAVKIRTHFFLRKLLGRQFKNPVYLSIEELALAHPIPLYEVEDHNGKETAEILRKLQPDLGILTNTRRVKREILEIPRHGFLNLHLSALPQYAGLDSIFWALYHGEKEVGVTVHFAAEEIDRGDIVLQRRIPVSSLDTEESLYEKALWLGTHLMVRAVQQLEEGTLERRSQDPGRASYFSWPTPEDRKAFRKRWKQARDDDFARSPRALHLITRMTRGGAQENTLLTALGLREKGFAVTLVTGPSWGEEGEILSEALEEGLELVILPELVREIHPGKDFIAWLKLSSWFVKNRYTIVHTHTSKAGFLGRFAAHFTKIPAVIHTPHGHVFHSYFLPWEEKLFLSLEREAAKWSDRLIALTEPCRQEHLALQVGKPEQWVTIPSGVDEKRFQHPAMPREKILESLGIPSERKVIGFIGRLAPDKGAIYFVEALPQIFTAFPETHCILVGDGEERPTLQKKVHELGLDKFVFFAGHQEDIGRYLSIFDLLVVPSLNEGMGRVIVEGGLFQKAVVAAKVGGIPDLIEDNKTGLLVERRNSIQIAEAVIRLLKDPVLAEKLGAELHGKVLNSFTASQMVNKIERLYQEVLTQKGLRPLTVCPQETPVVS